MKKNIKFLNLCNLYGNLLNTYGDFGNILIIKYLAKNMNIKINYEIISLKQYFDYKKYDIVFINGGQDLEQNIISKDIQNKKKNLIKYIQNNGVLLAICAGYQLLGKYYISNNKKFFGANALNIYTINNNINKRLIGNIIIYNKKYNEKYFGFENHNGMTFFNKKYNYLGKVLKGFGNNTIDKTEGLIYKNTFCTYCHGPILAKNINLAKKIINIAIKKKYNL